MPKPILNPGQQAAADGFFTFLFSSDKQMIISGPGGVGKTFLMGQLIDQVMPEYFNTCKLMGLEPEYDSVVMTATTNKAAEVLGLSTGRPTETIHSFLRLTVKDDHDTGRARLSRRSDWKVHERLIVFIDECSMIDGNLLNMIQEGTHHCKVIYVGDHCQLAPVTEPISPIYRLGLPFYELTQPMRNASQPALMAVCQQLRNTVETGVFQPIQIVPRVIDWVDDPAMEQLVEQTFMHQTRASRILSYTNKRVIEYNDHIRDVRQLPTEYGIGEILVNNQAIRVGGASKDLMLSVEAEVEIVKQEDQTEQIHVDIDRHKDIPICLEVRRTTLQSTLGGIYNDVALPVDRNHYADLIQYYQRTKNWNRYFFLKNTCPDLRARDAATVHKAQGSTYDTVFIDVGNLSTCHLPNVVARLLYVAFTRARTRVILYGDLAEKYGGLTT